MSGIPEFPALPRPSADSGDTLALRLLAEGAQPATEIAGALAEFIDGAKQSLDIAVYDCRLTGAAADLVRQALARRRRADVLIRLVYDRGDEKPRSDADQDHIGGDRATDDTHDRIVELDLPAGSLRAVHGFRALMHHKYVVRDRADVWTGSLNWSDDSFCRMENVVVTFASAQLARYFARDFDQLWRTGRIEASGAFATDPATLRFGGRSAMTDVDFSPGQGEQINQWLAARLLGARRRIVLCSMLFTSSAVLRALETQLDRGETAISGVYDATQMEGVLHQWRQEERLGWKIDAVERVMADDRLVGKRSQPYHPGRSHNFMHNKTVIIDDHVVTGSYNLSHAARGNAENMTAVASMELADLLVEYVETLADRFRVPTPTRR